MIRIEIRFRSGRRLVRTLDVNKDHFMMWMRETLEEKNVPSFFGLLGGTGKQDDLINLREVEVISLSSLPARHDFDDGIFKDAGAYFGKRVPDDDGPHLLWEQVGDNEPQRINIQFLHLPSSIHPYRILCRNGRAVAEFPCGCVIDPFEPFGDGPKVCPCGAVRWTMSGVTQATANINVPPDCCVKLNGGECES